MLSVDQIQPMPHMILGRFIPTRRMGLLQLPDNISYGATQKTYGQKRTWQYWQIEMEVLKLGSKCPDFIEVGDILSLSAYENEVTRIPQGDGRSRLQGEDEPDLLLIPGILKHTLYDQQTWQEIPDKDLPKWADRKARCRLGLIDRVTKAAAV